MKAFDEKFRNTSLDVFGCPYSLLSAVTGHEIAEAPRKVNNFYDRMLVQLSHKGKSISIHIPFDINVRKLFKFGKSVY